MRALICSIAFYFTFPPLLWLPFAPLSRRGYRLPMIPILFTPVRILFDRWKTYHEFIYWQARLLGLDDLDYELRFLGTA